MMNYKQAQTLFNNRKSGKDFVTLEHKTKLKLNEDDPYQSYVITYHYSPVVTIHQDDTYTLRTNNYYSPTTKRRINYYSSAKVYQVKGVWYLDTTEGKVEFYEGIHITDYGDVINKA